MKMMLSNANTHRIVSQKWRNVALSKIKSRKLSFSVHSSINLTSQSKSLTRSRKQFAPVTQFSSHTHQLWNAPNNRFFSSSATYDDEIDVQGEILEKSRKESWMINLTGKDNAWLTGPRPQNWFTVSSMQKLFIHHNFHHNLTK